MFQFTFTRVLYCCNLVKLNLNKIEKFVPKPKIFEKIINNKIDIKNKLQIYYLKKYHE